MGLDIYLYRYEDFEKTKDLEKQSNDYSKLLWDNAGEYEKIPQDVKDEIYDKEKAFNEFLGLDKYGNDETGKKTIEFSCERYPDHYFKIGYFRSSYNEGGIQRILRNLGLPTLDDVFNHTADDYTFKPDWYQSLENVKHLIEKFKSTGGYRVHSVLGNIFGGKQDITSEKYALDVFMEELKRNQSDAEKYNYSNAKGEFSVAEPLKVLAMIPGTKSIMGEHHCVYVVTESDNSWYIQALEIVQETIEYVLAQEDKEKYFLHWSG